MATIKSLSNLPDWLIAGIEDYQRKHNLQSWSQSAAILLAVGLHRATVDNNEVEGYLGGSKEAEAKLFEAFDASGEKYFEDWMIKQVAGAWGGKRS